MECGTFWQREEREARDFQVGKRTEKYPEYEESWSTLSTHLMRFNWMIVFQAAFSVRKCAGEKANWKSNKRPGGDK